MPFAAILGTLALTLVVAAAAEPAKKPTAKKSVAVGSGVVVTLKNGNEVEGVYRGKRDGAVWVELDGGEIGIEPDTVVKITPTNTADSEFLKRKAVIDPKDVDAWWELSKWAASRELRGSAQTTAETVIDLNPDHAEARIFLGFEKIGGRWLDFNAAQIAKGFTLFEGEWLRGEELALAIKRRKEADDDNRLHQMHAGNRVIKYVTPDQRPTSPEVNAGRVDAFKR